MRKPRYFKTERKCVEIIDGNEIINPAYKVERYQNFTIDPKESVNINEIVQI